MANSDTLGINSLAGREGKVAAITLSFWLLKVVTTTVGDLSGDLLSITLGMGYVAALVVALVAIAVLLTAQLRAERFHAVLYWALIFLSATVGAEISDTMARALHWGTLGGAGVLLAAFVLTLGVWRVRCGRIAVYPIGERREEIYYWVAVVIGNTLGSVLGDLVGDRLGFGLIGGIAVNAGVLMLAVVLRHKTRMNRALLFWTAFVFARVSF